MRNIRKYLQTLLLAIALYCAPAFAINFAERADDVFDDEFFPGILCDVCRDPQEHPEDFAALAFNAYFGDDPWMWGWQLGIPFRIYNLNLDWVAVWFEGVLFDAPTLLPNLMDIRLRLQNGVVITMTVLQDGPDMLIGERNPEAGSFADGAGGGSEGDDGYEEPEEQPDIETDAGDRIGIVEIIDPDDAGGFFDWEKEL